MINWNDLKYLLAVAHNGSALSAARALKVDQTTVQRRLAELEAHLHLRLVERGASGYRLTGAGRSVLVAAEQVAEAVARFERGCAELAQARILRLTCPEPIADRLARSGFLDRFSERHPDFRVEFVLADRYIDLAAGDADVALRSGDTDGVLVGRKIADSLWAVYASKDYIQSHGAPAAVNEIAQHPIVAFDHSLSGHRLSTWLDEIAPDARIAARSNSVLGLVSGVKSGIGIAALPTPLGDGEPDLVQVLPPVAELSRAWRLLCHPDNRRHDKVAAFFDFVETEIAALRPVLTG
ncbi:MAG: LysR family transcriptional regulator [Maritimibacter sp.]|nr:LysR family transcriptional regulator [Maritimibacter sp.]